jgi:hypothetical protein
MVKRQTWILLALFMALAGFAIYQKYNPKSETPDPNATPSATVAPVEFLFSTEEGMVTSLVIESREGETIGVARKGTAWAFTQPFEAEADQASVEEAASQVASLTILSRLELDLAAVGLKSPAYTVTVGFSSGKFVRAQIGDATPTDTGYYARKEDGSVLVISKYGMDALLNLLLYPPYVETPTPSPLPPTDTCPGGQCQGTPPVTKMP